MTRNPTTPSPPKSATFIQYDGLPEPIRNALLELETFIGDVDGKDTVIQTDEHTCIDDGTIDAEDAVKAFNTIVAALSLPVAEPTQGEIEVETKGPFGDERTLRIKISDGFWYIEETGERWILDQREGAAEIERLQTSKCRS